MSIILAAMLGLQPQLPPEAPMLEPIIVTGTRVGDYRDALAACLARGCPPDEDIAASAALAEILFLSGEHHEARTVTRGAIRRNQRHAAAYPEPLAEIHRAHSRIARHLGRDQEAVRSTRDILRTLRQGIPAEDHRHFTARFEIAQALVELRNYDRARRELRELERSARGAGREDVARNAELRRMWVSYLMEPHGSTMRELEAMADRDAPEELYSAIGARMLLIRIHGHRGEDEARDAAIADLGTRFGGRRQVLFSPPYALAMQESQIVNHGESIEEMGRSVTSRLVGQIKDTFIDVGFWITEDGEVRDLEVLRRSGSPGWDPPLMESIAGRRYSPAGAPTYRLERYTLTAPLEVATGSRIPQRVPRARVEYFDLTAEWQGNGA